MHRRRFILAGGAGLLTTTQRVWSQQAAFLYRIAFLEAGTSSANQHFVDAFVAGLREFGYAPGKDIALDVRWAEGQTNGFRAALSELIRLRPEVVVVSSGTGA